MNKFRRFLGGISAETCLNIDYFGCKSPKIAKRWGLRAARALGRQFSKPRGGGTVCMGRMFWWGGMDAIGV